MKSTTFEKIPALAKLKPDRSCKTFHVAGRDCCFTQIASSLIEGRSNSQNVGTRDGCGRCRGGQSSQGPPAGHDLFQCSFFVTPITSGIRNRSMSLTTRLRGTASM